MTIALIVSPIIAVIGFIAMGFFVFRAQRGDHEPAGFFGWVGFAALVATIVLALLRLFVWLIS